MTEEDELSKAGLAKGYFPDADVTEARRVNPRSSPFSARTIDMTAIDKVEVTTAWLCRAGINLLVGSEISDARKAKLLNRLTRDFAADRQSVDQ